MKIGIVSDGKFGDRAFEIIKEKFPTEWIMAPILQSIMVEDLELTLPACDLYSLMSAIRMLRSRSSGSRSRSFLESVSAPVAGARVKTIAAETETIINQKMNRA